MRTLRQTFLTALVAVIVSTGLMAQVCAPTAPVCVPGNGFAFQFAGDTDHGLKFNTGNTDYEYTNNIGNAVFGVDAFTGNISIPGGGALQIGPNRYAFQFTLTPNYGLFFNAAGFAYEFRTADASPVFSIGANTGNLSANGTITAGGNVNAPSGNLNAGGSVNVGGSVNATGGNVNTVNVNASGNVNTTNVAATGSITAGAVVASATLNGVSVKGTGNFGPTNGYLGVQGSIDFDGEDSLDIPGQEIGVLGTSTGTSSFDNTGVLGFSNGIGVSAIHELSKTQVDLATSNLAISATGDSRLDGDAEVTGRLGISTAAPNAKLHVVGGTDVNLVSTTGYVQLGNTNGANMVFDENEILARNNGVSSDLFLNASGNSANTIIQPTAGEVGIGTSNPSAKLDVVGTTELNGTLDLNGILDLDFGVGSSRVVDIISSQTGSVGQTYNFEKTADPSAGNDLFQLVVPSTAPDAFQFMELQRGFDIKFVVDGDGDMTIDGQGSKPGGGLWAASSDRRLKKEIESFDDGLELLMEVNPVTFQYNELAGFNNDGKTYVGVIAQEIQKVAPYMIESNPLPSSSDDGVVGQEYLSFDGTALIYMLVNSVQEQQAIIEELQEKSVEETPSELLDAMKNMQKEIDQLKEDLTSCCIGMKSNQSINENITNTTDAPWLGQNVPNPFDNSTIIKFYVPESVSKSEILVHDLSGKEIRSFQLEKGYGEVKFNESDIASGTYVYTLINDGEVIATKKMILN